MDTNHQQEFYLNNYSSGPSGYGLGQEVGGGGSERLPQWSFVETKELLEIRWELDQSFVETKRNKLLWEVVSSKMGQKGFHRTPHQCKCKWKNLVTRYKACEAEADTTNRQFPFFDDMRRIFSDRVEKLLSFDEGKLVMSKGGDQQVWFEDEEQENLLGLEEKQSKKRRKVGGASNDVKESNAMSDALRKLMRWQMQMEVQRMEEMEKRELERRAAMTEWRRSIETLAIERAEMDRWWREREEQRRGREEERAERRHDLMVTLLTKLCNNDI